MFSDGLEDEDLDHAALATTRIRRVEEPVQELEGLLAGADVMGSAPLRDADPSQGDVLVLGEVALAVNEPWSAIACPALGLTQPALRGMDPRPLSGDRAQ